MPIDAVLDEDLARAVAPHQPLTTPGRLCPESARLVLFGEETRLPVPSGALDVTFELDIDKTGTTTLEAWFETAGEDDCGAYYVTVERLGD